MQLETAGLDARDVEHLLDEREQVLALSADEARLPVLATAAALGIEREQLREAEDRVERRAQLSGSCGDGTSSWPRGRWAGHARAAALGVDPPLLGEVEHEGDAVAVLEAPQATSTGTRPAVLARELISQVAWPHPRIAFERRSRMLGPCRAARTSPRAARPIRTRRAWRRAGGGMRRWPASRGPPGR
jgi:hypothetical protein